MDDLVAFLRARIDEDRERALAAPPGPWAEDASHSVVDARGARVIYSVNGGTLHPTLAVRAHVLEYDPARALREVEAKRQQIAHYQRVAARAEAHPDYALAAGACATSLRHLATAYADHPGYQPEWAPGT